MPAGLRGDGAVRGTRGHGRHAVKGTRWSTMVATGLLLGLAPAAAESSMRKFLEGRWVGDGLQIRVDQDAVQANDNPEKPFE